jgi:3-hydroxybutyryl-CoA dehydratase
MGLKSTKQDPERNVVDLSEDKLFYKIGDSAQLSKRVHDKDIRIFAEVTEDKNPLHLDNEFASKTIFKRRIAHGILSAGLISAVIGNILPGNGTIYLSQTLNFLAPVYIGDQITAKVEVLEVLREGKRLRLKTQVINQNGTVVVDGEALVIPPRR